MSCRENILSEDYEDLIIEVETDYSTFLENNKDFCPILTSVNYGVIYKREEGRLIDRINNYKYFEVPKLFGLMDISAIEDTGAITLQNLPGIGLKGSGVIIGFIEDGIDVYSEVFRYSNGNTRIIGVWDQTNQDLEPPYNLVYGSYITQDMINEELLKENSSILRNLAKDSSHGTFVAGIAAGNIKTEEGFASPAPLADIAVVKLKKAKQYLKDYYLVNENASAYQENDILTAINFLGRLAYEKRKPLILCITLGTSFGAHNGFSVLGDLLDNIGERTGVGVCVANGNEGNSRHHFLGKIDDEGQHEDVEIRVPQDSKGFILELWGEVPDFFSVEIISPSGEKIEKFGNRISGNLSFNFLLDTAKITAHYELVERKSGAQLIRIRFETPSSGIWIVRVYGDIIVVGNYNAWLPITEFVGNEIYFLRPNPYTTLTIPADTRIPVSVGAYNDNFGGVLIDSGRGFPTSNFIKPSVVAPGVNVYGLESNGMYTNRTGTSVSAGITSGIMAQIMEWGFVRKNSENINTIEIKNYLIRGARRRQNIEYPNREWGYGEIDVYSTFERLRGN